MKVLIFCLVIVFQKGWVDRIWQKLQPDMQGEGAGFSGRSLFLGTDQTPRLLAAWRFWISFHIWWNDSEKRIWWFVLRPRLGLTAGSKVTCLPPAYFKHQEVNLGTCEVSQLCWALPPSSVLPTDADWKLTAHGRPQLLQHHPRLSEPQR